MVGLGAMFGGEKVSIEEGMAFRKALLASGRKFIKVRLINFKHKRMQAIRTLNPIRGTDTNGLTTYTFTESSGQLVFKPSSDNTEMTADILDCEFNRKFLASHMSFNLWEIDDEDVRKEIEAIANSMALQAVRDKKKLKPKEETMSDEQLNYELNRVQAELAKRNMAKSQAGTVRPIEGPPEEPEEPHRDLTPAVKEENKGKLKGKGVSQKMVNVE